MNAKEFAHELEKAASFIRQQQAEIDALNELNTMLKDAIEKRIEMDANRKGNEIEALKVKAHEWYLIAMGKAQEK